jgi:hypothetical protein
MAVSESAEIQNQRIASIFLKVALEPEFGAQALKYPCTGPRMNSS